MPPNYDPAGVQPNQVGPVFDVALGYFDPTSALVKMVGYVVSPSGNWQEAIDVTDEQHLVQISSPASTDRLGPDPQASQGDWSKGERQRVFIDPQAYYQTDGNVDVSTPGNLTLIPGLHQDTYTLNGTYNLSPIATDGEQVFIGISTGANNLAITNNGGTPSLSSQCNGHEILDFLYTPFGLVAMTDEGLWIVTGAPSSAVLVAEAMTKGWLAARNMAYLNDQVFYINNGTGKLRQYTRTTNTHGDVITVNASEPYFQCICSTTGGLFFATTSNLPFQNFFYIWSGSTADLPATRIYEVPGRVEYATEVLGTVYVLVRRFQPSYRFHPAWTLYSVVGSTVTLLDDARFIADPNFTPTCTSVLTFDANSMPTHQDFKPHIWDDGRFLYIAWPGLGTKRIDLVNTGISQIGANFSDGQASVSARRFVTYDAGPYVDVATYGTTTKLSQYSQPATTGSLTTSFFDFDSPGKGKIFRSVEFQLAAAPVGTQAVTFAYRLDQFSAFTALTAIQTGPRNFSVPFPLDTKGTEVQLKITLTADASAGSPIVTSTSVIASLGRVITATLTCRRGQGRRAQDQAPVYDEAATGQALQANIYNIRNIAGGRGYAFIPDPTQPNGVAQIQVRLIDYERTTPTGAAVGQRSVDGDLDMESDILVKLVEDFDP